MCPTGVELAAELVRETGIVSPPVNVFALLKLLKLELEFHSVTERASGLCQPSAYGKPLIVVNNNHSRYRQRFTIAHEIKHACVDNRADAEVLPTKVIEREANSFASHLLVPDILLDRLLELYGFRNAKLVSRVFGVSFEAAVYRIYGLEGYKLLRSLSGSEFYRAEKKAFREFQFFEIPSELRDWKSLESAVYGSNLGIHHCLICLSPIFDGHYENCWGCGANVREHIKYLPPSSYEIPAD